MRDLIENIEPDEDFSRHLADAGGYNHYGEPNFRIIWAQNARMETPGRQGHYIEEPIPGMNQPCWALQKWTPPEVYGSPEFYNEMFRDDQTEMCLTGPYPEFGRYETVILFKTTHFDKVLNRIIINTIPLDWEVIERAIPLLMGSQELTTWQRKAAKDAERQAKETEKLSQMTDRLYESLPSFYGPVSFAGQRQRTALIDREMAKVEQQWKNMPKSFRNAPPRGLIQKN